MKAASETIRRMLREGARLDGDADPALWTHAEAALTSLVEQYEAQSQHLETAAAEAHRRGVEAYELREQYERISRLNAELTRDYNALNVEEGRLREQLETVEKERDAWRDTRCTCNETREQLEAAREDAYREHQAVEGWSLKAERLQEQYEAMRSAMRLARDQLVAWCDGFPHEVEDQDRAILAELDDFVDSSPASLPPLCRCDGESCAIRFASPEERELVESLYRCRRESDPASEPEAS